jgi:hypothetical protein
MPQRITIPPSFYASASLSFQLFGAAARLVGNPLILRDVEFLLKKF